MRIQLIGDRSTLSPDILKVWNQAEELTKDNTGLVLNIAFNYGGRQEITKAAQRLAEQVARGEITVEDITPEKSIHYCTLTKPPTPI